jgi:hypothetical protein
MAAMRFGEAGRSPEDLCPVGSQSLDVLVSDTMRERVVQPWVLKTAFVMRGGERQKGGFAAGELEYGQIKRPSSQELPSDRPEYDPTFPCGRGRACC